VSALFAAREPTGARFAAEEAYSEIQALCTRYEAQWETAVVQPLLRSRTCARRLVDLLQSPTEDFDAFDVERGSHDLTDQLTRAQGALQSTTEGRTAERQP